MKKDFFLKFLTCAMFTVSLSGQHVYYVAPDGDDDALGTISNVGFLFVF